ncbi:MAG: glucose-6-phosphate isomerase [Pseudomonadota bacterium]
MTAHSRATPFPDHGFLDALTRCAARDRYASINEISAHDGHRERCLISAAGWTLDSSRNLLSSDSLETLLAYAEASGVLEEREALFDGRSLNHTENRAVLHTLLRTVVPEPALVEDHQHVDQTLSRMAQWVERVHTGDHTGHTGGRITDIINIGIGGSDLGPRMVVEALTPFHRTDVRVHFCANIDPADLDRLLRAASPASTLFVVCSKTLSTEETLFNAQRARQWLLDGGVPERKLQQHFLAVSSNLEAAAALGIPADNVLPMWDWVGGRFSLWSAIGWSIAFAVGMAGFRELLAGAAEMDGHFRRAPAAENMPLRLSLQEIWYVNFMQAQVQAVIPYHQHLMHLPAFLQQLSMESNGKCVNHLGDPLGYATAPVLWGDIGTNGQHSFHQLLHQGTVLCPIDFVLFTASDQPAQAEGKRRLLANGISQARALMLGRSYAESRQSLRARGFSAEDSDALAPHLVIPGNRPCNTLVADRLTPATLGALLALYEHKTFCSGRLWQINSFDQYGVELGKSMGAEIYAALSEEGQEFDPASNDVIERSRG